MTVLNALLTGVPEGWRVPDLYVGLNWTLAVVESGGERRAGVASTPKQIAPGTPYQPGHYHPVEDARALSSLLRSDDASAAVVGLAVLNALQQPDPSTLTAFDAADWLAEQCRGRTLAIFGRFPFIDDEIRPTAAGVLVFELEPSAAEYSPAQMADLLPRADIVAITGTSIFNRTIDGILAHVAAKSTVVILGPSTPLSARLLDCGIDALFGVRVLDLPAAVDSVLAGSTFQSMNGLQRVSLFKQVTES